MRRRASLMAIWLTNGVRTRGVEILIDAALVTDWVARRLTVRLRWALVQAKDQGLYSSP